MALSQKDRELETREWMHRYTVPSLYTVLWLLVFWLFLWHKEIQGERFLCVAGIVEAFVGFLLETIVIMWDLALQFPSKGVTFREFIPLWGIQVVIVLGGIVALCVFVNCKETVMGFPLIVLLAVVISYKYMNCYLPIHMEKKKSVRAIGETFGLTDVSH